MLWLINSEKVDMRTKFKINQSFNLKRIWVGCKNLDLQTSKSRNKVNNKSSNLSQTCQVSARIIKITIKDLETRINKVNQINWLALICKVHRVSRDSCYQEETHRLQRRLIRLSHHSWAVVLKFKNNLERVIWVSSKLGSNP